MAKDRRIGGKMEKSLSGKKVLITGASSGIGQAMALLFAREGANLVLVARRAEELSKTTDQCRCLGVRVLDIPADITDAGQVRRMAEESLAAFETIDILVNNAGYGKYGPFLSISIEEWDRMWSVNVRGMVLVTQAVLPSMIKVRKGHLLNISSIHGIHTSANASAYCATKFAVTGLTEALSKELWKHGIKVSVLCPGGVLTPFSGIPPEMKNQEFLEPKEVARVALDIVTSPGKALITRVVLTPKTRPFFVQEIP
jgi:3-oxoacyl-[acyl-carrier protein] reductase